VTSDTTDTTPFQPTDAQKRMLKLVKTLGAVLVLLFLTLVGAIVWKVTQPAKEVAAPSLALDLGLAASDIKQVTADGGTVVIQTTKELIVFDAVKKKLLVREPLK
jgi:cytoskeletal protein RodZ